MSYRRSARVPDFDVELLEKQESLRLHEHLGRCLGRLAAQLRKAASSLAEEALREFAAEVAGELESLQLVTGYTGDLPGRDRYDPLQTELPLGAEASSFSAADAGGASQVGGYRAPEPPPPPASATVAGSAAGLPYQADRREAEESLQAKQASQAAVEAAASAAEAKAAFEEQRLLLERRFEESRAEVEELRAQAAAASAAAAVAVAVGQPPPPPARPPPWDGEAPEGLEVEDLEKAVVETEPALLLEAAPELASETRPEAELPGDTPSLAGDPADAASLQEPQVRLPPPRLLVVGDYVRALVAGGDESGGAAYQPGDEGTVVRSGAATFPGEETVTVEWARSGRSTNLRTEYWHELVELVPVEARARSKPTGPSDELKDEEEEALDEDDRESSRFWAHPSIRCISTLIGHRAGVTCMTTLDEQEYRLASGSGDKAVRVWDVRRRISIAVLKGHRSTVGAVAALDRGRVASGSADKTIRIWDVESELSLATLYGHDNFVGSLATIDRNTVVSGSGDSTIKVWDLRDSSGDCQATLAGHGKFVGSLASMNATAGASFASGSGDRTVKVWHLASRSCVATLPGHRGYVGSVAEVRAGRLVSGGADNTARLWDLGAGQCAATWTGHRGEVSAIAVLTRGAIATGSADDTIRLWSPVKGGTPLQTLEGHKEDTLCLAPLGSQRFASGGGDKMVRIWGSTAPT